MSYCPWASPRIVGIAVEKVAVDASAVSVDAVERGKSRKQRHTAPAPVAAPVPCPVMLLMMMTLSLLLTLQRILLSLNLPLQRWEAVVVYTKLVDGATWYVNAFTLVDYSILVYSTTQYDKTGLFPYIPTQVNPSHVCTYINNVVCEELESQVHWVKAKVYTYTTKQKYEAILYYSDFRFC